MQFDDVIGNALVKEKLKKAIEHNTLSNTLLFSGPDGVGKSLFATNLAALVMHPEQDIDPGALKKIFTNNHPDLHVLEPEGKTSLHSIASIRTLISEVFMAPFEAKAKVFIINDADSMLPASANALLKTLEEPTLDSYIILISSKSEEILPTIISRCFKINFSNIQEDEMLKFLQEKHSQTLEEARTIAKISNGSLASAIEVLEHPNYLKKRDIFISILAKEDIYSYVELFEALSKLEDIFVKKTDIEDGMKRFKEIDLLLEKLIYWFRDLHLLKMNADPKFLFFQDKLDLLKKQNIDNLPSLDKIYSLVDELKLAIRRNIKLKHAFENFFLQIDFV